MENPIKVDWFGGSPILGNLHLFNHILTINDIKHILTIDILTIYQPYDPKFMMFNISIVNING